MPGRAYEIHTMTRAEVDLAIDWAALEGWNPGIHDAECFYRTDPSGFFLGVLDGEPVASVSAVSYGQAYGFLGFYIVKADYRKQGLGLRIWHEAMTYLAGRNVGLDGVLAQQDYYKKSGFEFAYRNIRYQWQAIPGISTAKEVLKLSSVRADNVAAYDAELFGCERPTFLECWISRPGAIALGFLQRGKIRGYGVLRKCRIGFKVGPLFADNSDVAEALFLSLTAHLTEGVTVFLDVPEVNSQAVGMAEKYGMTKVFETARMYTRGQPDVPLNRWFGVTTFELG